MIGGALSTGLRGAIDDRGPILSSRLATSVCSVSTTLS